MSPQPEHVVACCERIKHVIESIRQRRATPDEIAGADAMLAELRAHGADPFVRRKMAALVEQGAHRA